MGVGFTTLKGKWEAGKKMRRQEGRSIQAKISELLVLTIVWAILTTRNQTIFKGITPYGENTWELVMSQTNNEEDFDISTTVISSSRLRKRKNKLKSFVWDHFTKLDNGKEECVCGNCGKVYSCNSRSGTSHLKRHLELQCGGYKKGSLSPGVVLALDQSFVGVDIKVEEPRDIHEVKVGTFSGGLFLVHPEHSESDPSASRPFRVNAGPVHAYIALPDGKTCYLSELHAGKEVMVVDQNGAPRAAMVGRVKIESQPLILVEAMLPEELDHRNIMNIFLQNAETVGLVVPCEENNPSKTVIPVTSLKVGDEVLVRIQNE
ncbi:hypothetical protein QJS04_geneDACA018844 [Acorus gramineus]|uniref:BED-type domain-containing protein n=1 Tax=Acorus gramineus TaxID=55184 RepID=A0AAV9BN21_ACOGR|nr:hypothetical protein QJS04_geneDACA018844 [Acorus gramineus]